MEVVEQTTDWIGSIYVLFREFYRPNKPLIDITGFMGVIGSLFLQIQPTQSAAEHPLRMAQAALLSIFCVLLAALTAMFLIHVFKKTPYNRWSIVINGLILSVAAALFIFSIGNFTYQEFRNELLQYWQVTVFGFLALLALIVNWVGVWAEKHPEDPIAVFLKEIGVSFRSLFGFIKTTFLILFINSFFISVSVSAAGPKQDIASCGYLVFVIQQIVIVIYWMKKKNKYLFRYIWLAGGVMLLSNYAVLVSLNRLFIP